MKSPSTAEGQVTAVTNRYFEESLKESLKGRDGFGRAFKGGSAEINGYYRKDFRWPQRDSPDFSAGRPYQSVEAKPWYALPGGPDSVIFDFRRNH